MNLFKILETCATSYGCAVADLKRADRRENVTLARQTAITILLRKGLSPSVLATLLNLDLRALKYNAERAQKGNLLFAKRVREIETVLEKGGETASPEREVQSLLTKTCKALGVRLEGVEGGGRGESARARNLVALAMYKRGHSHALISKLLGRSSPSSSFNMCDEAEELIKISKYESVFKKLS